jgi:hypothetical protein
MSKYKNLPDQDEFGMGFSVAPGAMSSLVGAGTDTTDKSAEDTYLFSGDLSQMGTMGERLRQAGFDVRNSDVYPAIQGTEEIKRALKFIFDNKVPGWWNQRHGMLKYGLCTEEEFQNHFD